MSLFASHHILPAECAPLSASGEDGAQCISDTPSAPTAWGRAATAQAAALAKCACVHICNRGLTVVMQRSVSRAYKHTDKEMNV